MRRLSAFIWIPLLVAVPAGPADAHGLVGKRFFPSTLAIEDPTVSDELSLPSILHIKGPEGKETTVGAELSKTITPSLAVSVGAEYRFFDPADPDERSHSGFGNPELGVKYQLFTSEAHEAVLSLAFAWEIGGVGKEVAGAEPFDTIAPSLLFGKGFGDLPEALAFARPLAVTGVFGAEIPLTSRESNALTYGVSLQYSLPYLQRFVRDVGLPGPLGQLIPLVELLFSTPLDGGKTTGTVNPGIVWVGKYIQLGVEAVIPINNETGKNVGVRALVHFFLDDIYPAVFRPLIR